MSKINIIPIFVPHLGCPNDCVFCNQKKITGIEKFDLEFAKEKIIYFLDIYSQLDREIELAFYGGSFTAIDKSLQFELLGIARELKKSGKINRIRLSTRPDCINYEILTYLKEFCVDIIELGVQSLDDEVLFLSKRGHKKVDVFKAVDEIRKFDFQLGLQQMVGLPGDNEKKSILSCYEIINLNPDFVRIYPTLVVKNTELAEMYQLGYYSPLTVDEAVQIVTKLIMIYEYYNINIIRVGLQSSENLQYDKDVLAGPLHDAFRELCESEKLYEVIKKQGLTLNTKDITIYSNNRNISLLVGQKSLNKMRISDLLKVKNINFRVDNELDNEIKIVVNNENNIIDIRKNLDILVKGWEDVFKKY